KKHQKKEFIMALRGSLCASRRSAVEAVLQHHARALRCSAVLGRRAPPLGPMPNEDIDTSKIDDLEKYRSYPRYIIEADKANLKDVWWRTYRKYREEEAKELQIPLDKVKAEWEKTSGPYQIRRLAQHYGIFAHLFPMAYFLPRVMIRVMYGEDSSAVVHYGNHLTPSQAAQPPQVHYEAEENSLWTLLLTCPDEHLENEEQEYLHWLVGNIPGSAISSGEQICPYISPFPVRGTGFHRFVFILFKQEHPVDFSAELRPDPCLKQRTFRTLDFYRKHQDSITPAGLAFFQSQWDQSVTDTFHNLLKMREPVFEYQRPPVYHPPQKKYPHLQPLRYLDRYRNGANFITAARGRSYLDSASDLKRPSSADHKNP
ncbi:hypothetical protein DNTS_026652, partial [Danionella cerebrum]